MNHVQSPATHDGAIELEIQAKGKTAARVTPADVELNIASEHYFSGWDGTTARESIGRLHHQISPDGVRSPQMEALKSLTFCVLVLRNGFTVTGESACASPENFDAEIGRKIARENAVQKMWPLMGYALKNELARSA